METNIPANTITTVPTQGLFNSKKILGKIIQYWYLYLLILLFCIGYAWFRVHYATPMYKVYGQVIILDDKSNNSSAQALNGNGVNISTLFGSTVNVQNEIALLQNRDLCRRVVDAQQLYISYFHEGSIRAVELYDGCPFQVLFSADNDTILPLNIHLSFPSRDANSFEVTIGAKVFPWHFYDTLRYNNSSYFFIKKKNEFDSKARYLVSIQNPDAVADNLVGNLSVALLGLKSTILTLTYNTNMPRKGEKVLQGIMQSYVNRSVEKKNIISDSTIQFINQRIGLVGNDLSNIENTIQGFREQNNIANLSVQSAQLISNGNSYFQRLNDLEVQLQVIATMLSYIQNEENNQRPIPSLLSGDATFGSLVGNYNTAQVQRDKILLTLKNDNPIVANLNTQISGLRSDMIKSLQSQQRALTISKNDLITQNERINGLIQKIPSQERQFLDFQRQQDVRQSLFLFLLQRKEEISIAKASNSSNAAIVSSAKASYTPYEPVSTTAYTIAILIGLLLPTSFVVLLLLLNNKIESKDDVTSATPVTVLCEIGHAKKEGLIDLTNQGRSMLAEQFRIFRTNMDFALSGAKNPVILITSTMSGEGKSFIAANLGQIYAISGKRVLLMELDLRKPKLAQVLNMNSDNGFSNYILSNQPVQNFIKPIPEISNNLFLLSAGAIPPNPAELLLSQKTTDMITELRQLYDVIIIDTAPIGAVTDAQILSTFGTVSLYIVRQNYTTKNSLLLVNDLVLNNKMQSLYLVINDIKEGTSYRYGYGYGYGGYGYHEDEKSKRKWWQWRK